jgi:hypothetical protein
MSDYEDCGCWRFTETGLEEPGKREQPQNSEKPPHNSGEPNKGEKHMKPQYLLVDQNTAKSLTQAVNENLAKGWRVYGPPHIYTDYCFVPPYSISTEGEKKCVKFAQCLVRGDATAS